MNRKLACMKCGQVFMTAWTHMIRIVKSLIEPGGEWLLTWGNPNSVCLRGTHFLLRNILCSGHLLAQQVWLSG
jgi:hypothetical protein